MVFSSLLFVFAFLSLNIVLYFLCPTTKSRNVIMLIFSLVFYSWAGPKYLLLLVAMTWLSYMAALWIEDASQALASSSDRKTEKQLLFLYCFLMLAILGFFKYTGFFLNNVQLLTGFPKIVPQIVLPIGISFYTFQLISYVVDVYRKEVPAQQKFWLLLLYASLFHQCIAGPIVRYQTVQKEISHREMTLEGFSNGIQRFCVGLAKKSILANTCASAADTLLAADTLSAAPVASLWLGMLYYMLQIYLDFSAYSDMAIGMGKMIGFHYLENFNYPYIAGSVKEFWRRWHISLSTFFRDYVYIPLGGSRRGQLLTIRNIFIVWALTGFWHGASWNYILWGLYFFLFLLLERLFLGNLLDHLPKFMGWIYAMIVVFFGWVLFRFEDFGQLGIVLKGMFGGNGNALYSMETTSVFQNYMFFLVIALFSVTPLTKKAGAWLLEQYPSVYQVCGILVPAILLILSTLALVGNSYNPFLYFQF